MALQFDSSNPITQFIKGSLVADGVLRVTDVENKDWAADTGEMVLKDVVAITSLAFLNKSNAAGATPAIVEPRQDAVLRLWQKISEIPGFGEVGAKEKTVSAQPVVLKALAKLAFDLNFSNRRPDDGADLFEVLLAKLEEVDFSHDNPVWRYFDLSAEEVEDAALKGLEAWLPSTDTGANRDVGSFQGGFMRFGAKHNDIYPIIGDMIRWQVGLPNRHM